MLDDDFTRITRNGRPWWLHVSGRAFPVVAGGAGDGDGGEGEGGEGGAGDGDGQDEGGKPKTITMTSAQLAERLARAKPADYDDLKSKAAKLDEIEAANKTEIEKAADARTAAEQRAAKAEAEAMRLRVATKHGISADDADLFLTGTDEETLTKQAKGLQQLASDRKKKGNRVPNEGNTPPAGQTDDEREFVRELFGT